MEHLNSAELASKCGEELQRAKERRISLTIHIPFHEAFAIATFLLTTVKKIRPDSSVVPIVDHFARLLAARLGGPAWPAITETFRRKTGDRK